MPVAIASTFLTAPPTSTPTRSVVGVDAQRWRRGRPRPPLRAAPASALAATSAVGWPRATSMREARAATARRRAARGPPPAAISWPSSAGCPPRSPCTARARGAPAPAAPRSIVAQRRPSAWRRSTRSPRGRGASAGVEVGADRSARRQRDVRQVARVARARSHRARLLRHRAPTAATAWRAAAWTRQRRAPGAGAEHRDRSSAAARRPRAVSSGW